MIVAEIIFMAVKIWMYIGAAVAAVFLTFGIDRIDEDARGAYVFRPILIPAFLLIWPIILWRWFVLETGRDQWPKRHKPPREAHFWIAIIFAVSIPVIMLTGFAVRQERPADFKPERISTQQEQSQ